MSALEALQLERPEPLLADTEDGAALLADLLRLQTPPPLQTGRLPLPSLQALCVQAVCDGSRRRPAAGPHWRLESLPSPLARLAADALFVELRPLDRWAHLLAAAVTRHARLAWVHAECSEPAVRLQAQLLRQRADHLRELHFRPDVHHRLVAAFLDEFLATPHGRLRALAGRPQLTDCQRLLSRCPALTHLQFRTPPQFELQQLRSAALSWLELQTDVTVDLAVVDACLPALETLRLATWYRCSPGRRPLLLAPVEGAAPPCCRRLRQLEVSGYQLGGSLQAQLPELRQLALRRCSLPLADLFRHQQLESLRLQNVDGPGGGRLPDARLPAVTELDLHSQWGGRRCVDLAAVSDVFPALRRLTLRADYYRLLLRPEAAPAAGWLPQLGELTLVWLAEEFAPPELLLSRPLPALRRLALRRRCRLFPGLLATACPRLETLDLHSTVPDGDGRPLPGVRRLVARLCSDQAIRDICRQLPDLAACEIHLGYMDHGLARDYRRVVDELTERGVDVTVLEE